MESAKFVGKSDSGPGWREDGFKKQEARRAYKGIRDFCQERGCPLMIVSIPNVEGRHFIPLFNFSADQVRDWTDELGVTYLNLMPWIADSPQKPLRGSKKDGHMNARGQSILAHALVKPLRKLLDEKLETGR